MIQLTYAYSTLFHSYLFSFGALDGFIQAVAHPKISYRKRMAPQTIKVIINGCTDSVTDVLKVCRHGDEVAGLGSVTLKLK